MTDSTTLERQNIESQSKFGDKFRRAVLDVVEAAEGYKLAPADGDESKTEHARRWWATWEQLLSLYNLPANWRTDGGVHHVIPQDLMRSLRITCGYLAQGQVPLTIEDVRGSGRTQPGPEERNDIQIAVAYISAAKHGYIADPAPVKAVTNAFAVNRRTIQDWQKNYSISTTVLANIPHDFLPAQMLEAGKRYRTAGRSQRAIAARARKRR